MPQSIALQCSMDNCLRPLYLRGYCAGHYYRLRRYGNPTETPIQPSVEERFMQKISVNEDGCWIWLAAHRPNGYGRFGPSHSTSVEAHRWSYEHFVGPIPAGLVIDHLCRNPACVNPDHLEPVTNQVNVQRGLAGDLRTHCPNGHPYESDNLAYHNGRRRCLTCRRQNWRRYKVKTRPAKHGKSYHFRVMDSPERYTKWSEKLDADKVRVIRAAHASGRTLTSLAQEYGVHRRTIAAVVDRRSWRDVD